MMDDKRIAKISIDEVVEAAAAGVLRALDARQAAAGGAGTVRANLDVHELIRSGFFVDFVIRAGGNPFPVDIAGGKLGGPER